MSSDSLGSAGKPDGGVSPSTVAEALQLMQVNMESVQETEKKLQELLQRQSALHEVCRRLEQNKLLEIIRNRMGLHSGRPVAALVIYRCLLHWKSLEGVGGSDVLEELISVMSYEADEDKVTARLSSQEDGRAGNAVGSSDEVMAHFAYWLSVTATLLAMVNRVVAPRALEARSAHSQSSASSKMHELQSKLAHRFNALGGMFKRAARGGSNDGLGEGEDLTSAPSSSSTAEGQGVGPGQGVSPSQVFRQELDMLVLKVYYVLRDQFKKQLTGVLPACIQAPAPLKADNFTLDETELGPASPDRGPSDGWNELVVELQSNLALMRQEGVPRILIKCLMKQVLGFVDTQLFNQLLLRPECCCTSNAKYVLEGLRQLDTWIMSGSEDGLRALYGDLKHIREATVFLVTPNKANLGLEDMVKMCPSLNPQQLYRLCTTCWDDSPAAQAPGTPAAMPEPGPGTAASTAPAGHSAAGDGLAGAGDQASAGKVGAEAGALTPAALPRPPPALLGMVSGEVLEELKTHHVTSNGGLIVTFLLDEDPVAIIAPQGATATQVLNLIDGRDAEGQELGSDLYKGLPIPPQLQGPDCPPQVFEFMERDLVAPT